MNIKNLYDISWKVTEEEYRDDSALSYSTLATYERSGFNELDHLFDRKESASLVFGSAVDSIITGGQTEFDNRFLVAEYPDISESVIKIIKELFKDFHITHQTLEDIPDESVLAKIVLANYQSNWKPETRVKDIKKKGEDYYNLLHLAENKVLITSDTYQDVLAAVRALKESDATKWYFEENNPFDNSIERFYQLKFKANLEEVNYRCMMDLVIVDHKNKVIIPVDLKTSSHTEWDFPMSFIQWSYFIQAKLYAAILKDNLERDDYFKDFTIEPYRFIVVNKSTLTPLVWKFNSTFNREPFKVKDREYRHPFDIGKELQGYLNSRPKVPNGISENDDNIIEEWIQ